MARRINRYDKVVLHDIWLDTKLQTQQTIWWSDKHTLSSLPLISFFFFWGFCDSKLDWSHVIVHMNNYLKEIYFMWYL